MLSIPVQLARPCWAMGQLCWQWGMCHVALIVQPCKSSAWAATVARAVAGSRVLVATLIAWMTGMAPMPSAVRLIAPVPRLPQKRWEAVSTHIHQRRCWGGKALGMHLGCNSESMLGQLGPMAGQQARSGMLCWMAHPHPP